jgi:SAM-dependent methyltransferase
MGNYVKTVLSNRFIKDEIPQNKIDIEEPSDFKSNVVTVICGKNRTGKSYLLNSIYQCLKEHNTNLAYGKKPKDSLLQGRDVRVVINSNSEPLDVIYIGDISELSRPNQIIPLKQHTRTSERGHRSKKNFRVDYTGFRQHLFDFLRDSIADILKIKEAEFDLNLWDESEDYREKITNHFDKGLLYQLSLDDDLVKFFFEVTGGRIYIAYNPSHTGGAFDLFLVYSEQATYHWSKWSDGQKIFFICLILIKYHAPEILIFDEIENRLHPEYITKLLEYLKLKIPQSIISTHHPHIIFSKFVDKVWYLDLRENPEDLPFEIRRLEQNSVKSPKRVITNLDKEYQKLLSTYKLFNETDSRLIRLSESTIQGFNELINKIFNNIFFYEIVVSNRGNQADLQTEELGRHIISKLSQNDKLKILDIGAGYGRTLFEIDKLKDINFAANVSWFLYEPFETVRNTLRANVNRLEDNYRINVIDSLDEAFGIDFAIFSNVVHEITPHSFADYLAQLPTILSETGEIIIIDLYPLLMPEKFSVPYKAEELLEMLAKCGWSGKRTKINFKSSKFDAYWITVRPNKNVLTDKSKIRKIIEKYWKYEISKNRCRHYGGRVRLDSVDEIIEIMCELITIASISSYFHKQWI